MVIYDIDIYLHLEKSDSSWKLEPIVEKYQNENVLNINYSIIVIFLSSSENIQI